MQYVAYNSIKSEQKMIDCDVRQWSIPGPPLFLLYINDQSTMWDSCFSILFADDTNMFMTGKDIYDMCHKLNEDLTKIQEWLCCNKLSLNLSKNCNMVFTPRNKGLIMCILWYIYNTKRLKGCASLNSWACQLMLSWTGKGTLNILVKSFRSILGFLQN